MKNITIGIIFVLAFFILFNNVNAGTNIEDYIFQQGDFTWSEAVNQLAWIQGKGTWLDPYIIKYITINGQNSSSCIEIRNSNAYFIIEDCTFYNSSSSPDNAGIYLYYVENGKLINNNCSDNC